MRAKGRPLPSLLFSVVCLFGLLSTGCLHTHQTWKVPFETPHELEKTSLPSYMIEPPDILLIDAVRIVPLPPYKLEPLDALLLQATNTLPTEPIAGIFGVEADGMVTLGPSYGKVQVAGLTTDQARAAIEKQLGQFVKEPKVQVALAQSRAMQQIRGEHLVRPDGTVGLGIYGSVYVAGLTLEAAKATIEAHLSQYLLNPEVSVDVFAYNSKVFYIIFDGGGYGQQMYRLPITGNETVLDALSQVSGLPAVSSKNKIWIARPNGLEDEHEQVLPVDWKAVAMRGSSRTNYQLFPGDRLYVQSDRLIAFDNLLAKIISPIERVLGVTLLGQQTIISFDRNLQGRNGGGF